MINTILLLIVITSVFGGLMYSVYSAEQAKKRQWQEIATRNELTFNDGIMLLGGATVTGRYQGYTVDLRTVKTEEKTFTQLSVTRAIEEPIEVIEDLAVYKKRKSFITLLLPSGQVHLDGFFEMDFGGGQAIYKQEGFEGHATKLEKALRSGYYL